jgi:hypothetical protein
MDGEIVIGSSLSVTKRSLSEGKADETEQYQFETADYTYRGFVTNLKHTGDLLVSSQN